LCTGYDKKKLTLSANKAVRMTVEADITGTGMWVTYEHFEVGPDKETTHDFPAAFGAYWLRVVADQEVTATAQLVYE
jgi:hypothetical protein